MKPLKKQATFDEIQKYIDQLCKHHGWNERSDLEVFLMLAEEIGELAKAIRLERRIKNETVPEDHDLAGEFADVLSYLVDLANRHEVDLETALRAKQNSNISRSWN